MLSRTRTAGDQSQQSGMAHQTYRVHVNIIVNGMRNCLFKPREVNSESPTECLQRYVTPGYGRNRKYLFLNINNMVLQTILEKDDCNFHHKKGGIWRASVKCFSRPGVSKYCCRNNVSFEQLKVWWRNRKY
jgi:hypothetical protein